MTYTAGLTPEAPAPTVAAMPPKPRQVCRACGERLQPATPGGRKLVHPARPDAGVERDHPPKPVDPLTIPADVALEQLEALLRQLKHASSPAARDRIAVEVAAMAPRVMAQQRQAAAQQAVASGMSQVTYAKLIGVTKAMVGKLMHPQG